MAAGLSGSEILKIAAEIRALVAAGQSVCDLTVGDFSPGQFPDSRAPERGDPRGPRPGETNYPPATGILDLRHAVQRFYASRLGLDYPVESILIAGGSRPAIYTLYRSVVDVGDPVVYPAPSWNNNHYCTWWAPWAFRFPAGPRRASCPPGRRSGEALPGARLLASTRP